MRRFPDPDKAAVADEEAPRKPSDKMTRRPSDKMARRPSDKSHAGDNPDGNR
jgi:hypothetical protein